MHIMDDILNAVVFEHAKVNGTAAAVHVETTSHSGPVLLVDASGLKTKVGQSGTPGFLGIGEDSPTLKQ